MAQKLVPEAKNGLSKFKNAEALVEKWLKEWLNNTNKE